MIKEVLVYDNIIPKDLQEEIIDKMYNKFAWYFVPDITEGKSDVRRQERPGFSHIFYLTPGKVNSDYSPYVDTLVENTANKLGIKKYKIDQSRGFLQLPLNENFCGTEIDTPHVDLKGNHLVFLYYVKDCDGDTIIYKQKTLKGMNDTYEELEILTRVTPKQGRMIVFDGTHWHTGTQPKSDIRCLINTNIRIDESIN